MVGFYVEGTRKRRESRGTTHMIPFRNQTCHLGLYFPSFVKIILPSQCHEKN